MVLVLVHAHIAVRCTSPQFSATIICGSQLHSDDVFLQPLTLCLCNYFIGPILVKLNIKTCISKRPKISHILVRPEEACLCIVVR